MKEHIRAWLATQEDQKSLHIFDSPAVLTIFDELVDYVERLRTDRVPPAPRKGLAQAQAEGMNLLLLGVKGVGKTKLSRAIVNYVNRHPDLGIIGVYVNCELEPEKLPAHAMLEALGACCGRDVAESLRTLPVDKIVDRVRQVCKKNFFVVYDEVQAVYVGQFEGTRDAGGPSVEQAKQRYQHAHQLIGQLYTLGKDARDVATIITGSSKRTRRYAFREDEMLRDMGPEHVQRAAGYPNLNNTVFSAKTLEPLRSKGELREALETDKEEELARIFFHSGGVGRDMRESARAPLALPDGRAERDVVLRLLWHNDLLQTADDGVVRVNEARCTELESNPWAMEALNTDVVERLLGATDDASAGARGRLALMEDSHILYSSATRGKVTFLRPVDAVAFAKEAATRLGSRTDEVTELCHMMLAAEVDNAGSLGHRVEVDILKHAAQTCVLDPDRQLRLERKHLRLDKGALFLDDSQMSSLEHLPADTVFNFKSERGQDGFWLEQVEGNVTLVHLAQVKGGGRDMTIGCGNKPTADGDTLLAISHRLITRSYPDVLKHLKKAAASSGQTLKLGNLVLLTTKKVDDKLWKKYRERKDDWLVGHHLQLRNDLNEVVPECSRHYYR